MDFEWNFGAAPNELAGTLDLTGGTPNGMTILTFSNAPSPGVPRGGLAIDLGQIALQSVVALDGSGGFSINWPAFIPGPPGPYYVQVREPAGSSTVASPLASVFPNNGAMSNGLAVIYCP